MERLNACAGTMTKWLKARINKGKTQVKQAGDEQQDNKVGQPAYPNSTQEKEEDTVHMEAEPGATEVTPSAAASTTQVKQAGDEQ